ncbi:hypothetical protein M5D96_011133, partial [Drosophila gunungcola]
MTLKLLLLYSRNSPRSLIHMPLFYTWHSLCYTSSIPQLPFNLGNRHLHKSN